jgi:hypothetical protein
MNAMDPAFREDPYIYVAKMLGAFALENIPAIIWPERNVIKRWNQDMIEPLEKGYYKTVFGE